MIPIRFPVLAAFDWERLPVLSDEFYGNTLQAWAIAAGAAVLAGIVLFFIRGVLTYRSRQLADHTANPWDDVIVKALAATRWWFLIVAAIYIGLQLVEIPDGTREIIDSFAVIITLLQIAVWGTVLLSASLESYVSRRADDDPAAVTTVSALGFVGRLVLYSVVILLILDNLGIDVTALVAGLGIGGIAVALAAQNILGDLFASLSIVLDKPFVLGDFIIVGDLMGTVEKIGLKTTRVRSLSGEQLIFSNTDLLSSRVRNFKRMQERRVVFKFGVLYQTEAPHLREIPELVKTAIEAQDQTRFDRSHFASFGDSSLDFENVYYVSVPDYNVYMDVQQAINLTLFEAFAERGIEFAYPTRTIFLERDDDESVPAEHAG